MSKTCIKISFCRPTCSLADWLLTRMCARYSFPIITIQQRDAKGLRLKCLFKKNTHSHTHYRRYQGCICWLDREKNSLNIHFLCFVLVSPDYAVIFKKHTALQKCIVKIKCNIIQQLFGLNNYISKSQSLFAMKQITTAAWTESTRSNREHLYSILQAESDII